jgi:pimeloyl-ACP methyl ester carboxylesterase
MSTYLADSAEDLTVEGPSARFTYRRMGPRGGVLLLLLHRFRGTIDWWNPEFLDHLAADHDVIVFDNVGIGYTDGEPRGSPPGPASPRRPRRSCSARPASSCKFRSTRCDRT